MPGGHRRNGKLESLPRKLRQEVCERIYDGESHKNLMAWLNDLPVVKEILASSFEGVPISGYNFSRWVRHYYTEWLRDKESLETAKEQAEFARELVKTSGRSLAAASAAIISRRVLDHLRRLANSKTPLSVKEMRAMADTVVRLCSVDQTQEKLLLERDKSKGRRLEAENEKQRLMRDQAEIVKQYIEDQRAKDIVGGPGKASEKINALGKLMFGEKLWAKA